MDANTNKPLSKTVRILNLIAESGEEGMRLTDIQRALWEMTHPKGTFTRAPRGYWCTNLYGGPFYHKGLLNFFCVQRMDRRWVRPVNAPDHQGTPWKVLNNACITR